MSDASTPSPLRRALVALATRQPLAESLTAEVFESVMRGEATAAQIAALLMGLRAKGETADEVAGAARALRGAMVRVAAEGPHLVDTCGTGGGTVPTFNISTVAALVAAGAGAAVPKHGNRSYTSRCGSADVLEALGVRIVLDAPAAARVLTEARVVFLFAPSFHPAMKHVGVVRRELGTPSVMNLVGPLANPAGVRRQVIGVAERDRAGVVADALLRLGAEHALVVHGRVGMDEISPHGITDVWEVRDGAVRTWEIDPERFRLAVTDLGPLQGGEPAANAERLERLLCDGSGDEAGLAAVLLNAGAAIYVAGIAASLAEGIGRAREVVASGAARAALDRLRKATASIS
ncbi:MAG: anthranilate phosphoribosyltransferase [Gemmatimonadales bacterium]